ncbi:MAG: hypothetical protein ABSH46_17240 [Bryobacteraceae bacterium]
MRPRIPRAAAAENISDQLRQLAARGLVRLPREKFDIEEILALPSTGIPLDALRAAVESEREED